MKETEGKQAVILEAANVPIRAAFITEQKVDADAAYQRLSITRDTLKQYKAAINATNTAGISDELKSLYAEVESTMKLIELSEQKLILQGE